MKITIQELSKSFGGRDIFNNFSLEVDSGVRLCVCGPNGTGKSTLLRLLAGVEPADGGRVILPRGCRLGFVEQELSEEALDTPLLTYVLDVLHDWNEFWAEWEEAAQQKDEARLTQLMHRQAELEATHGYNPEHRAKAVLSGLGFAESKWLRTLRELSGGWRERAKLARVLTAGADVLLLDEPGVGVDPLSRQELWQMVSELSDDGMTVIWSTAYLDEAARCPGIIMLDGGRILYDGPPEGLTARVEGRVFHVSPGSEGSKAALARWTRTPGVEDALMQGSRIRVLLGRDAPESTRAAVREAGGENVPARLEDAYMHMVGGLNQEPSPYGGTGGESGGHVSQLSVEAPERIVAKELTKRFGDFTAADHISFTVRAGEIFGLLGPNGAGKSTTFRMLCGLSRPTSGQCSVDGVDLLRAGSAARSRLGYMAQKFSLYLDIPVRENILTCAELYGLAPERRKALLPVLAQALDYLDGPLPRLRFSL